MTMGLSGIEGLCRGEVTKYVPGLQDASCQRTLKQDADFICKLYRLC